MKKNLFVWGALVMLILSVAACAGNKQQKKREAEAIRNLGEAYLRQENYRAALKELLKAEKLNPKDHILQNDLGIAYRKKGKTDLAIAHFKKAIALKPNYGPALNNLGTAYFDKKEWDNAIACFKRVSEELLYATPHFALYNLGRAYYNKKEYDLSEKYFLEALDAEPRFVEPLIGLGRTYLATGRVSEAVAALSSAVKQSPEYARTHYYLAEAYRAAGEHKKALKSYYKVIELEPHTPLSKESEKNIKKLRY
jgi:type IV pilus assembly protein PilF